MSGPYSIHIPHDKYSLSLKYKGELFERWMNVARQSGNELTYDMVMKALFQSIADKIGTSDFSLTDFSEVVQKKNDVVISTNIGNLI